MAEEVQTSCACCGLTFRYIRLRRAREYCEVCAPLQPARRNKQAARIKASAEGVICPICENTFHPEVKGGPSPKTCSHACQGKLNREKKKKKSRKICPKCGAEHGNKGSDFCSRACAGGVYLSAKLAESRRATCPVCSEEFTQRAIAGGLSKTCSHICAGKLARLTRGAESQARRTRLCAWCGADFVAPFGGGSNYAKGQGLAVFCSPTCRDKALHSEFASKQQEDAHRDLFGEIDVECPICHTAVPRLLGTEAGSIFCSTKCLLIHRHQIDKVAKTGGYFLDPDVVFERDNWRCYLCKQETPRALRGTTAPDAPEMEHVIPISAGGPHTYENVRCACRRCNGIKGAKPLSQFWMNFAEIELIGRF